MPQPAQPPHAAAESRGVTYIAADTQFILQLQAGDEEAQEVYDIFTRAGCYFIVTDTVMHELGDIARNEVEVDAKVAEGAICHTVNNLMIQRTLEAVQHGIADIFARKLIAKDVLEEEHYSDGLCIAEASQLGATIFVTNQPEMLGIENIGLHLFQSGLDHILLASVEEILKALDGDQHGHQPPA